MFPFNQSIFKRILSIVAIALASASCLAAEEPPVGVKARHTVSTEAHSYAFRYIQANKLITSNGMLYATFLQNDFDAKARTFDLLKQDWVETGTLGRNRDDHGGAAIAIDSLGHFHAAFGGHGVTQFRYVRSSYPTSISQWGDYAEFGWHPTYPSIVVDENNVVHMTYRLGYKDGEENPSENAQLYYQYKLPDGSGWKGRRSIAYFANSLNEPLPVNYGHYHHSMAISPEGELFVLVNFYHDSPVPQVGKRSRHVSLMKTKVADGKTILAGGAWETIDGSQIATKLGVHPNTPNALVHDVETEDNITLTPSGLALDKRGNPWVLIKEDRFKPETSRPSYQFLKTHDGESWSAPIDIGDLAPEGMTFGDQPLSISVSADDTIYLAGVMNNTVGLLYGKILDGRLEALDFVTIDPSEDKNYLGVTLERSSNQTLVQTPLLGYGWCYKEEKGLPDCHAEIVELSD